MIKLGRSFWWIAALIAVSFLLTRLPEIGDNPIYARMMVVFVVILVVNGAWALLSMTGLDLSRVARSSRKQVGEIFTENFEVINRSIIPKAWVMVSDQAKIPGSSGSRVLTGIGGKQIRRYVAYTQLGKRGWFRLGPTQIETGDIFGLFLFKKIIEPEARLLVIPYTVNIQAFPAPFGILPGGRALRQKTLEVTPYAAGVREYVPGDPLKRIHWPSSARKQKLIVKEFEKDPLAEVWIFLDARESVHIGLETQREQKLKGLWFLTKGQPFRLPPETEEYAISIAASIAKYYISQKREVGLVSAGQNYSVFPAERGQRQLGKILETLAVIRAEGKMPIWGLISSQLNHLARGSTVILITPSSEENIHTAVLELIHRGLMPVVFLIDQSSFGGQNNPDALARELTSQGILNFIIREGDDLKAVMEKPRLAFNQRHFLRNA